MIMQNETYTVQGNLVDIINKKIYAAEVVVANGKIKSITPISLPTNQPINYLLPGFIDSHIHIESSMLVPSEFARLAVVHGTVATISDPHEIANVCGLEGVEFMIDNGKEVNFKFNFGAPSCVPATIFETAGAALNSDDVKKLLERDDIKYLSEMMNFPGVLYKDEEVMKKISYAKELGKPIDGHAPGLRGDTARQYIAPLPPQGGNLEHDNSADSYDFETADPISYGLLKEFVKHHRSQPTQAEAALWEMLRGKKINNYKFRRQHIIANFIADFVCLDKKLIIEIDGAIHQLADNIISDEQRTIELKKLGYSVIRFTNNEVLFEIEKTLSLILIELEKIKTSQLAFQNPPLEGGGAVIISTDHECFTSEEALDKLKFGMKILIREGSAAKNFEALIDLLNDYPDMIMFCSDDKHPDSLILNHINALCARAVAKGIDVFKVLLAACINPIKHYKLDVGMLRVGDAADFIVVEDLINFNIKQTYINGALVAENGVSFISSKKVEPINKFDCSTITATDLIVTKRDYPYETIPVIEALDGQLITNKLMYDASYFVKDATKINVSNEVYLTPNIDEDLLKIVVINRYFKAPVAKAFIKNFGLVKGAIASTVAHDSHNIVAVGVDDESLANAINLVIKAKGGVSAVYGNKESIVALPVAGLMSIDDGYKVAANYTAIDKMTKEEMGSTLLSPFMTLSFMALLVIPNLKLSDKGLFDGEKFEFV